MKKILYEIAPEFLKAMIRYYLGARYRSKFKNKSVEDIFTIIYQNNVWGDGETSSGTGSTKQYVKELTCRLPELLRKFEISSMLDLPCGDFNWMKNIDLRVIDYTGADIVKELIEANTLKYASDTVRFQQLNIITDRLPSADLLLCRDCFVHLPNQLVIRSLENIKSHPLKYLLVTSFPKVVKNKDIIPGEWRPVNLEIEPFNLKPIDYISEKPPVKNDALSSKRLIMVDLDKM